MVAAPRRVEGKIRLGCLVAIAVLALAAYVVKDVGAVYWRYYQIQDAVKTQAGLAPARTDQVITERRVAAADTRGQPLGPKVWSIRRTGSPSVITIRAAYDDSVVFALLSWHKVIHFHFTPGAEVAL